MDTKTLPPKLMFYGALRFVHSLVELRGLEHPLDSVERVLFIDIRPSSQKGETWSVAELAYTPHPDETTVIFGYVAAAFMAIARGYNLYTVRVESVPDSDDRHFPRYHRDAGGTNQGYIPGLDRPTQFIVHGLPDKVVLAGERFCRLCGADFSGNYHADCLSEAP